MALVLILRECEPGTGSLSYRAVETYWNTLTRAVETHIVRTNVCDVAAWSVARVVDTYCLAPGVSPFTQRQVYHVWLDAIGDETTDPAEAVVPTGTVRYVDTDGVTACALTPGGCTLAVTVPYTAAEGVNTLGSAVVSVTGAVGDVEYSLDHFQSDVRTSPTLYELPAGAYEVTVREVRPGGCTARASFTIGSPYGKRFTLPFLEDNGTACKVDIYLRGYTGSVETVDGAGRSSVVIRWPGDAADHFFAARLRGSECEILVSCDTPGQLADLYGSDERQALVIVYRNSSEIWRGHLLPEQWQEPLLPPPYSSTLRASDGLGALKDKPFARENGLLLRPQLLSHLDTIRHCLALAGHRDTLDIATVGHLWSERMPAGMLADYLAYVGTQTGGWVTDKGEAMKAGEVLAAILSYYGLRIYQWAGQWRLERLSDLSRPLARQFFYDGTGNIIDYTEEYRPEARIYPYDPALPLRPHWVNAGQVIGLVPAVREVILTNEEQGDLLNLLPEGEKWAASYFTATGSLWQWRGTADYSRTVSPTDAKVPALKLDNVTPSGPYLSRKVTVLPSDVLWPYEAGSAPWQPLELLLDIETDGLSGGDPFDPTYPLTVETYTNGELSGSFDVDFVNGPHLFVSLPVALDWIGRADPIAPPVEVEIRLYPRPPAGGDVYIRHLRLCWGAWQGTNTEALVYPLPVEKYISPTRIPHATREDTDTLVLTESYEFDGTDLPLFPRAIQHIGGGPVSRWYEEPSAVDSSVTYAFENPGFGTSGAAGGDLLARDRLLWQRQPSKVLTGTISGLLPDGPGSLIADENASLNLFFQTDTAYDVARREWTVRAVECLAAVATPPEAPADDFDHLLLETGERLLTETDAHLVLE